MITIVRLPHLKLIANAQHLNREVFAHAPNSVRVGVQGKVTCDGLQDDRLAHSADLATRLNGV